LFDLIQRQLVANKLLDVLFSEAHRCQRILRKVSELFHVEPRVTLEGRQRAHYASNLRSVWANTEPSRFMSQDQQVDNELDGNLVLVHASPSRQRLHKIGHPECLC